jgi:hypothetical protein
MRGGIAVKASKTAMRLIQIVLSTGIVDIELSCDLRKSLTPYADHLLQPVAANVALQLIGDCVDRLECDDSPRSSNAIGADQTDFTDIGSYIHYHHPGRKKAIQQGDQTQVVISHPEDAPLHMLGQVQMKGEIAVKIIHPHDSMRTPKHAPHEGLEKMETLAGQRVCEFPQS